MASFMSKMPKKMSFFILLFCIFLSFNTNNNSRISFTTTTPPLSSHSPSVPLDSFSNHPVSLSVKINGEVADDDDEYGVPEVADNDVDDNNDSSSDDHDNDDDVSVSLQYDYYRNSCPKAERIVRSTMNQIHRTKPYLIPAIIRLVFHDCFIQAGGPFYPLYTGRRDGSNSYADIATYELPSPYSGLSQTLTSFKAKGFDEREMVSLLGAHSIGEIHCEFFNNRLYNFSGTNEPDPSIEVEFLNLLRSRCSASSPSSASGYASHRTLSSEDFDSTFPSGSPSSSVEEPGITMASEQPQSDFGTMYYRNLLQGRGILFADQQLMEGEETRYWIKEYAVDPSLFQKDFALAMMKLSDLHILTPPTGSVRLNCSKVA
ncbi:hypothetical protein PIB30_071464 [Stylosanthes scabra]|uniref:Peroxidase n=1 Tax=Stylosanthes scabra TaxID=79078 RepID=A0ABU6RNW9_9FABA|nr:hypothetical protein [Stylosanthes scabra]